MPLNVGAEGKVGSESRRGERSLWLFHPVAHPPGGGGGPNRRQPKSLRLVDMSEMDRLPGTPS